MNDADDRWVVSEIRRLDGRIDSMREATQNALSALGKGDDKLAASRALAFAFVAAVVSLAGLAVAIFALLGR